MFDKLRHIRANREENFAEARFPSLFQTKADVIRFLAAVSKEVRKTEHGNVTMLALRAKRIPLELQQCEAVRRAAHQTVLDCLNHGCIDVACCIADSAGVDEARLNALAEGSLRRCIEQREFGAAQELLEAFAIPREALHVALGQFVNRLIGRGKVQEAVSSASFFYNDRPGVGSPFPLAVAPRHQKRLKQEIVAMLCGNNSKSIEEACRAVSVLQSSSIKSRPVVKEAAKIAMLSELSRRCYSSAQRVLASFSVPRAVLQTPDVRRAGGAAIREIIGGAEETVSKVKRACAVAEALALPRRIAEDAFLQGLEKYLLDLRGVERTGLAESFFDVLEKAQISNDALLGPRGQRVGRLFVKSVLVRAFRGESLEPWDPMLDRLLLTLPNRRAAAVESAAELIAAPEEPHLNMAKARTVVNNWNVGDEMLDPQNVLHRSLPRYQRQLIGIFGITDFNGLLDFAKAHHDLLLYLAARGGNAVSALTAESIRAAEALNLNLCDAEVLAEKGVDLQRLSGKQRKMWRLLRRHCSAFWTGNGPGAKEAVKYFGLDTALGILKHAEETGRCSRWKMAQVLQALVNLARSSGLEPATFYGCVVEDMFHSQPDPVRGRPCNMFFGFLDRIEIAPQLLAHVEPEKLPDRYRPAAEELYRLFPDRVAVCRSWESFALFFRTWERLLHCNLAPDSAGIN